MTPPWFFNVRLTGCPSLLKVGMPVGLAGGSVGEPPQAASKIRPVNAIKGANRKRFFISGHLIPRPV